MSTFEFNGITKQYLLLERNWSLPAWAPIERDYIAVPGRAGGIQTEMRTGMRRFALPVIVRSQNAVEKEQFVEDMAKWLIHKEPKTLRFSKYPNRTMYAQVVGTPDFEQMWDFGVGTVDIICSDPYKYAPVKNNVVNAGQVTVENSGSVPVYPTIKATASADLTHLQVFDGERYFQIGRAMPVGSTVTKKEEVLLNDAMASLVGWSTAGMSVDGGVIAGAMETNGFSMGAGSYGTSTIWHGPSVKKSVPQAPITDFKIRHKFIFKNPSAAARGRIEIYLLDEQSVDFAKFSMKRTGAGSYGNAIEARAGGGSDYNYFANYAGARGVEWRDFDGLIEFSRVGDVWTIYTAMVDPVTKKHHTRATFTYKDIEKKYVRNLAQIQLHIATYGTAEPATMRSGNLEVFRINPVTEEETNVIAVTGDEIEVDFKTKKIYLNGEQRPDLKAFGSNFFALPTGSNTLLVEPSTGIDASLEWEEGYL